MTMWIRPLISARSDARPDRQVQVGQHRRLRDARIDDDERRVRDWPASRRQRIGWLSAMLAPISRIDVGAVEVLVGAGRAVAAERPLVAGHRGGHAERRVAVVVARAEAELHQLAERVELLGHELAGADDADRVGAVAAPARRGTARPSSRAPRPSVTRSSGRCRAQQRIARAVRRVRACGARTGPSGRACRVHRMIGIAAHADGAAVLDADEHAAADRAVAAGGRHPACPAIFCAEM